MPLFKRIESTRYRDCGPALGSFVLLPIGFALAGWATELLGAPAVFLIGGIGIIVLVLLGLSHPAVRNLD